MGDSPKSSGPSGKSIKSFSCVRCFERKVKCSREYPCSGCLRSKVECIFRIPAPPRRRKRKSTEESIHARLRHYEDLLREQGIDPASPAAATIRTETTSPAEDGDHQPVKTESKPKEVVWAPGSADGLLITDHGRSRFIENKLWTTVSEELHHSKDALPDSETEDELETPHDDGADFVLGMTSSPTQTANLHPSPEHILKLWQIFLTNVNPLMKIVHAPTLQRAIEDAIVEIEHIPRTLEALLFAIYAAAVLSMRDADCQATFQESRATLQARYRLGVRRSLTRARFMASSDLVILQALVIYLLIVRQDTDARTLWTLSGVATRIGQSMGVHRDGTILGLDPFETEMRRRLWWQINLLDFKAAEMSGFGGFSAVSWWNTKSPSNVNDADMWPGMKEKPVEHKRPTEMVVCLLHYEMGGFWRQKLLQAGVPAEDLSRAMQQWLTTKTIAEKDAFIDEYTANLEERILRYCDPSVPLEMAALIIGRSMCKSVRFMAHHPRRYASGKDIPEDEREFLWTTCIAIIEADNLCHSHRALQRFHWHIDNGFQWHSFIHVLGELIVNPMGKGRAEAWPQLEDVFENHPSFISESRKPLHLAIGNLCIKAWRAREKAHAEQCPGAPFLTTPQFISQLRRQHEVKEAKIAEAKRLKSPSHMMNLGAQAADMKLTPVSTSQSQSSSSMQDTPVTRTASISSQFSQPLSHQHQQAHRNPQQRQQGTTNAPMPHDPTFSPDDFAVMDDMSMSMDWQRWDTLLNDVDFPVQPPPPTSFDPAQLHFLGQYGQQGYSWPLPTYTVGNQS